ncbi:MAG: helix-turn-helix transcriptional regulator [Crocinitomicaceae bacterium]|nr:helix-turn-helix transcriptional regulator [Crocinitomicaceae bacterium]
MLIQDRILVILKSNNLSASEFASKIGINRSNLSHVLSGRNKPSLDFLAKIITNYPNVNASWLITGETREGGFTAPDESKRVSSPNETRGSLVDTSTQGVEKIVVFYTNGTFKEYSLR